MNQRGTRNLLWAVWAALAPGTAFALSTDRDQPMYIEADKVHIDEKSGVSTYRGNVSLTQGSMHLTADKAAVHNKKDQTLEKVMIVGNPVRFRQRPDDAAEDVRAESRRMEYFADKDRLNLIEEAKVWQGGNVFTGNRIVYDTLHHVVTGTKAPGEKSDRVRITIQPKKNDK